MNASGIKTRLVSVKGIIIVNVILLLLALAESFLFPWAPFFPLFAIIALVLALAVKTSRFGRIGEIFKSHWLFILIFWLIFIFWDQLAGGAILKVILNATGVSGNPFYSMPAAIDALFAAVTTRMGIPLDMAQMIFAAFVLIWAPIGEEFFYRGYVYGGLRERYGFWPASLVSSAFFGVRHMLPFLFLLPQFFVIPALNWGVLAFVFGLLSCYLYEKTGSIVPGMIGHFLVNMAAMLVM